MGKSIIDTIELQELVKKLKDAGHSKIVNILLDGGGVFTKKNRLNKSGACRVLGWKSKQLEDALAACREVLKDDFD